MEFPLNDLQKKLGYTFENILLLHEALTHDFDESSPEWDIFNDGNVFYKKRKLHRLKCVGVSVLKLLSAEKAIIAEYNPKETDFSQEGYLTQICQLFTSENYFRLITDGLGLWEYIHTRKSVNRRQPTIQKEVVQAIYGAVFIDAGGCDSENLNGLNSVRNLFDLLFTKYFSRGKQCRHSRHIFWQFDVYHCDVKTWLLSRKFAEHIEPYSNLEKKIGYTFNQPNILKTGLTHDSVKGFDNDFSHYEGLEFLGDAVYELVICEYLFWNYLNDVDGKLFNFETLRKFVSKNFQTVIANGLELKTFIIKPSSVTVNETHDFLESVIGAIYIDSESLSSVKTVLVELCRKFEKETVESCNTRLPFELRTYYGSWHYRQDEKLNEKITEEHELPPKRQDVFRIESLSKLSERLEKYNKSKQSSGGTGTIQSCDSKVKVVGSESWCNQQEFGRVSLYQSWIRMLYLPNIVYDRNTEMLRIKEHTYNTFKSSIIPECASNSNSTFTEPESKTISYSNEPTFSDVYIASSIISIWIFNWVMFILFCIFEVVGFILLKFIKLMEKLEQIMLNIISFLVAVVIFVFGFGLISYAAERIFKLYIDR